MPPSSPSSGEPSRHIEIFVLGPMGENEDPAVTTAPIGAAVEAVLREPDLVSLLERASIAPDQVEVRIPDAIQGQDIIHGVLSRLDTADLVIFNLTPKPGRGETSPNVFYELGLVHALGIPAIYILRGGDGSVPFYAQEMKQIRVADFNLATLTAALRPTLREFLDPDSHSNFINDRVTQFFGLPIVDISAAIGLATGYYHNFIARMITEAGYLATPGCIIRQVVYVRPSSIGSTYGADAEKLKQVLAAAGRTLEKTNLEPPDGLNKMWVEHVKGVVLDLPRTIYPLQYSPRLLAMLDRGRHHRGAALRTFDQRYAQLGERLLDRVETAIDYHARRDGQRVRRNILHFSSIPNVPRLLDELLAPPA